MNRLARMVVGGMVVAIGLAVGISGPAQAAVNLVTNGSFETGNFSGWTQTGNTGFTGVECPGVGFAGPGDGACDAFFGPVGSDGGISQVIIGTVIGQHYVISFDFLADGGTPSDFSASFGGVTLVSRTNPAASPYQILSFNVTTAVANPVLAFNFRDDPGFLKLDSASVSLPEPGTMALLAIGMTGLLLRRRKTL